MSAPAKRLLLLLVVVMTEVFAVEGTNSKASGRKVLRDMSRPDERRFAELKESGAE